jgi:hypothetical protein
MPEDKEFRIGDLGAMPEPVGPPRRSPVDAGLCPTLAAWLGLPSPERRRRTDALAEQARQESRPEVVAALQAALRLLSEIPLKDGGRP